MLPHFPALLLLLVSSGGSDFSPPPPPPWKVSSTSRPSPKQPPAGRPERGQGADTLTSSPPEIKVRNEVLLDAADHLRRPSGDHYEASPANQPRKPRAGHGGLAREGSFIPQFSRMVSRPAQAPPAAELSTLSISSPPRPWGSSNPSGRVNTWVISGASGEEESAHSNHHLTHQKPSLSTARGCLHPDAPANANQIISHTPGSARLSHPLTNQDFPLHQVNLHHNNVPSSVSRDTSLTRPSGEPLLNEIRVNGPSGSSSKEKLGHSSKLASTHPEKGSQDDDSLAAETYTFKGSSGVHTQDTHTEDDHTVQSHISKASVKNSHAAHLKHEIGGVGGGGGINLTLTSTTTRHTRPQLSTVLEEHNRQTPILLVSDNPDNVLMTKNKSSSNISSVVGNSSVYEADALLSTDGRNGSQRLTQETAATASAAALPAENRNKKAKNSLFRANKADREAGWKGSSPMVLQREKREAEGTRKNEFVVVDAGANEGQSDMAAGQGQGGGAALRMTMKPVAQECMGVGGGGCLAEDSGQKKPKWGRTKNLSEPFLTVDSKKLSPGVEEEYEDGEEDDGEDARGEAGRVKRWSSVLQTYDNVPTGMYSRVFPGSFAHLYSSYNPAADTKRLPYAEALQAGVEGSAGDTLVSRGSQVDGRYERKSSRASGVHSGWTSSRVKGTNKHMKGERGFTKTPQQRHARSRNRAKRKGECYLPS